jgi:hypothetical protein
MSMILLPLLPNFIFTSEAHVSSVRTVWENAWTLTTFHENGKVNSTFFPFPQVIWNGSEWVDYIFNSSDISGGIGSVYVKFRPTYATIYEELRYEFRMNVGWLSGMTNQPTYGDMTRAITMKLAARLIRPASASSESPDCTLTLS